MHTAPYKTAFSQVPNQCKKTSNYLIKNKKTNSLQSVPFSHSGTSPCAFLGLQLLGRKRNCPAEASRGKAGFIPGTGLNCQFKRWRRRPIMRRGIRFMGRPPDRGAHSPMPAKPPSRHRPHERRPAPDEPVLIYGIHAIEAALRNPDRVIHRVFLTDNAARRLEAAISS